MGRSPCCDKVHINKGAWTKEEDQRLIAYIRAHGEGCWRSLPKAAGLQRCGKSCRLRWINYLRPDLKRGNFSPEEDELIIKLHAVLGNKWSVIAGRLPGRTDNEIKNYWNTHIKRKLVGRSLDPRGEDHLPATVNRRAGAGDPAALQMVSSSSSGDRDFSTAEDGKPGGRVCTEAARCPDLNIDITQPCASPPSDRTICFCYLLGFRGSEACSCQSGSSRHFLGFWAPLDQRQQTC